MFRKIIGLFLLSTAPLFLQAQSIAEIQGTGDASPYVNQEVTTTGIVYAVVSNSYFIQDGTDLRSGIYVYDQTQSPNVGDEIRLTASVAEFFDLTELVDVTAFEVLSTDNPLPTPIELKTGEINNEDYELSLIHI